MPCHLTPARDHRARLATPPPAATEETGAKSKQGRSRRSERGASFSARRRRQMRKAMLNWGEGVLGARGQGGARFFLPLLQKKRDRTAQHARPSLPPPFCVFGGAPPQTRSQRRRRCYKRSLPNKGTPCLAGGLVWPAARPLPPRLARSLRFRGEKQKDQRTGQTAEHRRGGAWAGKGREPNRGSGKASSCVRAQRGSAERPQSGAFAHRWSTLVVAPRRLSLPSPLCGGMLAEPETVLYG